jgi:pimeloyl-ACP methyl ester carboxylesterase
MLNFSSKSLLILLFLLIVQLVYATDEEKEKRWATQISDSLLTGDAVELPRKSGKFLAIYAENQRSKAYGAVILIHGMGAHPDWPEVIHPLRTELPEYGWSTLSIQMPVLDNDKKVHDYIPLMDEVAERIDAAIKFLEQKKIYNIVIMGHSLGTTMSAHYLANTPRSKLRAYVGISMVDIGSTMKKENTLSIGNIKALEIIKIPVLDIYGSEDSASVITTTRARKTAAAKNNNTRYRQVVIEGADHFYHGYETPLVKRIRSWLSRYAAGSEIKVK